MKSVAGATIRLLAQLPSTQLDDIETTQTDANGQFALRTGFLNQPEGAAFVPMIHNDFTMVRRTDRGQRLALGVKSRLIRDAASRGLERITTEVRTDNGPMLAINATLGFRRIAMRQLTRAPAITIG